MHTKAQDESLIAGVADRLRRVLEHRPGFCASIAQELGIASSQIKGLCFGRDRRIDEGLVIDLVAIVVRDDAIDPHWLLTGEYDLDTHRAALALVENGLTRHRARCELRCFVNREWTKQQASTIAPLELSRAS